MHIEITDKDLCENIKKYCELNNIENNVEFITKLIVCGFNIEKYGNSPIQQKTIQTEKIVEKPVFINNDNCDELKTQIENLNIELYKKEQENKQLNENIIDLKNHYETILQNTPIKNTKNNDINLHPGKKSIISWVPKEDLNKKNKDDIYEE